MSIQTRCYDAANYLRDDADCAGYLSAVMASAPVSRDEIAAALADVARARGLWKEASSQTLFSHGTAALDTLIKAMRTLGLRLTVQPDDVPMAINPRPAAD